MIKKKICMIGTSSVGKTSLVARFVGGFFSEKYLTTVGVKIDNKSVNVGDREVYMALWDLAGEDEYTQIRPSTLKGSSGYLLVADTTRPSTLDSALKLQKKAEGVIGNVPFILALNKVDLTEEWAMETAAVEDLAQSGWTIIRTSAKTGEGVEELFSTLAAKMLQ